MKKGVNMQVGDKVYTHNGYYNSSFCVYTIERETKKQWILSNGKRYWKETCRPVGSHYGAKIELLTPEVQERIDYHEELSKLKSKMRSIGDNANHVRKNITAGEIKRAKESLDFASLILQLGAA